MLMKWTLTLNAFCYEAVCFTGLVPHAPSAFPELLYPSNTKVFKTIDDEIPKFESSSASLVQRQEEKGTSYFFFGLFR